ncbi:hypothetical protein EDB85DRAFT_548210 [Lactarius pseudohatsudake]|nr:hypothetical protein EDB85DRAFT_548210 [Lactarius pseudohatsudake]
MPPNISMAVKAPTISRCEAASTITRNGRMCAYPMRGIQLLCSLSYKKNHANEQIRVGIYDIYAKGYTIRLDEGHFTPLSCVLWKATHLSNVPQFISHETETVRIWQSVGNSTRHSNVHDDSPTSHPTGCHRHHHKYTRRIGTSLHVAATRPASPGHQQCRYFDRTVGRIRRQRGATRIG